MIKIELKDSITPTLKVLATQLPTIAVNAINRTAFLVRQAEQEAMRSVFDRPTPWILNTIWVEQATLAKPVATVGPNDWQERVWNRIIAPHVYGGPRLQKTVEQRMVRTGLLPAGWFILPASGMPLDAYGNLLQGELIKMLSWLQALEIGNYNPNSRRQNKTQRQGASYVLAYPGRSRLSPGIYKRIGKQLLMMLRFTNKVTYQPRLPWFETAQKVIDEELEKKIRSEIYKVMES